MSARPGRPRKATPSDFPQEKLEERQLAAAVSALIGRAGGSARVIDADSRMAALGLSRPQRVSEALRRSPLEHHVVEIIVGACAAALDEDPTEALEAVWSRVDGPSQALERSQRLATRAAQVRILIAEVRSTAAATLVWEDAEPLLVVREVANRSHDDAADLVRSALEEGLLPSHELKTFLADLGSAHVTRQMEADPPKPPTVRTPEAVLDLSPDVVARARGWVSWLLQGRSKRLASEVVGSVISRPIFGPLEFAKDVEATILALARTAEPGVSGRLFDAVLDLDPAAGKQLVAVASSAMDGQTLASAVVSMSYGGRLALLQGPWSRSEMSDDLWSALDARTVSKYLVRQQELRAEVDPRAYSQAERSAAALRLLSVDLGFTGAAELLWRQMTDSEGARAQMLGWAALCRTDRETAAGLLAASFPRADACARLLNVMQMSGSEVGNPEALVLNAIEITKPRSLYYFLKVAQSNLGVSPNLLEDIMKIDENLMRTVMALWVEDDAEGLAAEREYWLLEEREKLARLAETSLRRLKNAN